jgi:hypothetical protein
MSAHRPAPAGPLTGKYNPDHNNNNLVVQTRAV